jgi:guanylate kinase
MTTVFIISAPSGSGKSTLVRRLLAGVPGLMFSISYTTRAPRGAKWRARTIISSPARSSKSASPGEFLEHAEVFGNYYGTHRGVLERAQERASTWYSTSTYKVRDN